MLQNQLQAFGLSENEAAVYLASLTLGPSSALEIARNSSIKRATVYLVIESLQEKGLMHIEYAGLKRKFVAASPEQFEEKMNRLSTELASQFSEGRKLEEEIGKNLSEIGFSLPNS